MNLKNQIILACYAYIVGLSFALLHPLDPSGVPVLRIASALTLILAGVLYALRDRAAGPGRSNGMIRSATAMMGVGMILLGITRYTSANSVPDMRIGELRARGSERALVQTAALVDTSRIRVRKCEALDRDVRFRLVGELDARIAERNEDGVPQMDAQGRWKFRMARTPVRSDPLVIRAGDPVGTEVIVPQPFNRLTGVEWIDGPESCRLELDRISNHSSSFVRDARAQSGVTVLGRITGDPRVYDFQTVLIVTPEYIQYPANGPFFRVEGGDIQVTVQPEMQGYARFARTSAMGADIVVEGELTAAGAASNPGGFDPRRYNANYNIYGMMRPFAAADAPPAARMVAPEGRDPRQANGIVRLSLDLRDRMLRIFKFTMPYPQSAFIGGVTLGLRYGLSQTEYPGDREGNWFENLVGLGRSEARIADDFRISGVNHVLAVSGLHVTIITVMLVGIFSIVRFPRQVYVPFIIVALVVFTIITGARPSTLRAVIMNGLFLLTWAYFENSLRSSALLGVPVAAFLILIHNPLVVVDPSFTLSFGAILALALLTAPSQDLLMGLSGNRFLVAIVFVVATTLVGIGHWALLMTPSFLWLWIALAVGVFRLAAMLDHRGLGMPPRFAFRALPSGVSGFIAAQIAIQLGMMIPLSAYYFCRWPFAGAYSNLIAIPLIGVVVQLAAIAGLVGLIPGVGPYIALLLNAANWLFSSFFLWLAHVCAKIFPYPLVRRPGEVEIAVFYVFMAWWIWHKPVWKGMQRTCERLGWTHRRAPALVALAMAALISIPAWVAPSRGERPPGLRVTVLSVGYGSSILVQSPGGKNILIDAGYVQHERSRRNDADRTILTFLSTIDARRLEGFIVSSPLPERSAGASTILKHLRIGTLVIPPLMAGLEPGLPREEFERRLGCAGAADGSLSDVRMESMYHELIGNPDWPRRPSWVNELAPRGPSLLNRWAGWEVRTVAAGAGTPLFRESAPAGEFRIEVLAPDDPPIPERPLENNGLCLRVVYGDFAMLIPGALHYEGQRRLAAAGAEALKSQVLVVPYQGAAIPVASGGRPTRDETLEALERAAAPLLGQVRPEIAILEFGNPRPVLGDEGRSAIGVYELTRRFYMDRIGEDRVWATDQDQAIIIQSDGHAYSVDTQARRNRARGGADDAVPDIAVGF